MTRRRILVACGLVALLVALTVPTLAANVPSTPDRANATENAKPPAPPPGQANKPEKSPKVTITVSGTIHESREADGRFVFTLEGTGTIYTLEFGPPWFHVDDHPLESYVGQSVTVAGEAAEGSTEIEVETIDGAALREPGKPPWAGGGRVVGDRHPGWHQGKADRFDSDCWPPGHCKGDAQADR